MTLWNDQLSMIDYRLAMTSWLLLSLGDFLIGDHLLIGTTSLSGPLAIGDHWLSTMINSRLTHWH